MNMENFQGRSFGRGFAFAGVLPYQGIPACIMSHLVVGRCFWFPNAVASPRLAIPSRPH